MNRSSSENDKYLLSSLDRAIDILNELAVMKEAGVTELSKKLNIGKAIVFRTLYTMEKRGLVRKNENSRYTLGMRLAILGRIADSQNDNFAPIHYILTELAKETGSTVYASILTADHQVFFIDTASGSAPLQFQAKIGSTYPAYCSGSGKLLLSTLLDTEEESRLYEIDLLPRTSTTITNVRRLIDALREIRQQGYSIDNGESVPELICYAMPVEDPDGNFICSLSISGLRDTMTENRELFFSRLRASVQDLGAYSDLLKQYVSLYQKLM